MPNPSLALARRLPFFVRRHLLPEGRDKGEEVSKLREELDKLREEQRTLKDQMQKLQSRDGKKKTR